VPVATYDEIADWYEEHVGTRPDDPLDLGRVLRECLEVGCGTGMHAAGVRALGRTAVGVDLSAGDVAPRRAATARRRRDPAAGPLGVGPRGAVRAARHVHRLARFAEGGGPTPAVLAVRAVRD
jgi:SAM-dependent methyltransferase